MILRWLAGMPRGRPRINYSPDFISTLLEPVDQARAVCTLLYCDAVLRSEEGDAAGAMDSCRAMLNSARYARTPEGRQAYIKIARKVDAAFSDQQYDQLYDFYFGPKSNPLVMDPNGGLYPEMYVVIAPCSRTCPGGSTPAIQQSRSFDPGREVEGPSRPIQTEAKLSSGISTTRIRDPDVGCLPSCAP